jgi:hypothetical protein
LRLDAAERRREISCTDHHEGRDVVSEADRGGLAVIIVPSAAAITVAIAIMLALAGSWVRWDAARAFAFLAWLPLLAILAGRFLGHAATSTMAWRLRPVRQPSRP